MGPRPVIAIIAAAVVATALALPQSAMADLRLHVEAGAVAPLDEILRQEGSGFGIGGSIDYEVVDLLAVGLFYNFTDFLTDTEDKNILDHAIGARLDLRFVRHNTAGWFGRADGDAYGEAFIELDLEYHFLGNASRIGWGLGLGYRVIVAGPFGLGPFFRFRHVVPGFDEVSSSLGHQFYVTFGLTMFLSFDLRGEDSESEDGDEGQDDGDSEDEWSEFEPVGEAD